MEHDFRGHVLIVVSVSFAPVIAGGVAEDVAVTVERGGDDRAAYFRMALQSMFGIFVPEVKGAVATGGREGAVLRVEGDCVDGVNFGHVPVIAVVDAVAFE